LVLILIFDFHTHCFHRPTIHFLLRKPVPRYQSCRWQIFGTYLSHRHSNRLA
jgi:hypothetical protein